MNICVATKTVANRLRAKERVPISVTVLYMPLVTTYGISDKAMRTCVSVVSVLIGRFFSVVLIYELILYVYYMCAKLCL